MAGPSGQTAEFQLPYPTPDDNVDVPRDVQALADRLVEVLVAARRDDLIGEMKMWPTESPPDGFLICNGDVLLRAGTYASLFAVVGTEYNIGGEAGNSFRIPDLRGRVAVGVDDPTPLGSRLPNTSTRLGDVFGEERHQLITSELPSHVHQVAMGNRVFDTSAGTESGYSLTGSIATVNSGAAGGDVAHNNTQPSQIVSFIIRYA